MELGNCEKCSSALAVVQKRKFRLQGDAQIFQDRDGRDLLPDASGKLSGVPATEWIVECADCGREHRHHPYQKEMDAAVQASKGEEPSPPAFLQNVYSEANGFAAIDRQVQSLTKELADLRREMAQVRESLAAQRRGKAS